MKMKKYLYLCLIFLVLIFVSLLIYRSNIKQLPLIPLTINTDSVTKVETIYYRGMGSTPAKNREITLLDFNKALNIIKSHIIPDARPAKSSPWVLFVLYKNGGEEISLDLLLRGSDIMIVLGKTSWLIPRESKGELMECLGEIISDPKWLLDNPRK